MTPNPQPSEAHRNHIVPIEDTNKCTFSDSPNHDKICPYCAVSLVPSEDTNKISTPFFEVPSEDRDNRFRHVQDNPQPSEDTEELDAILWKLLVLNPGMGPITLMFDKAKAAIDADRRTLLAGIVEKLGNTGNSPIKTLAPKDNEPLTVTYYQAGFQDALAEVTAIIKAATPGKEE